MRSLVKSRNAYSREHFLCVILASRLSCDVESCKKCANVLGIFMCVNIHGHGGTCCTRLRIALTVQVSESRGLRRGGISNVQLSLFGQIALVQAESFTVTACAVWISDCVKLFRQTARNSFDKIEALLVPVAILVYLVGKLIWIYFKLRLKLPCQTFSSKFAFAIIGTNSVWI